MTLATTVYNCTLRAGISGVLGKQISEEKKGRKEERKKGIKKENPYMKYLPISVE